MYSGDDISLFNATLVPEALLRCIAGVSAALADPKRISKKGQLTCDRPFVVQRKYSCKMTAYQFVYLLPGARNMLPRFVFPQTTSRGLLPKPPTCSQLNINKNDLEEGVCLVIQTQTKDVRAD